MRFDVIEYTTADNKVYRTVSLRHGASVVAMIAVEDLPAELDLQPNIKDSWGSKFRKIKEDWIRLNDDVKRSGLVSGKPGEVEKGSGSPFVWPESLPEGRKPAEPRPRRPGSGSPYPPFDLGPGKK